MKISYNWLQDLIKQKLPQPAQLVELLTMRSFETGLIGQQGKDYLLEIDVLPNRAHDCFGHLGIAREIAAILKLTLKEIDYEKKIKPDKRKAKGFLKVEIKDKKLCPRYTGRVLTNVKTAASPQWIQERLKICGLRPISNVVDITNYVMLETGQPLHAFDADKLANDGKTRKIIVRRAKKGEKITTLDGDDYVLDENILVIADEKNPICIAGIKGGKYPEIDQQTKQVILEAANFSPQIIRQGSEQLKLETDASWRFERHLDPNLTQPAIDMAAYLIQEIANGQILQARVDVYSNKIRPRKIKLDIEQVKKLLGINISVKEAADILKRLGFNLRMAGQRLEVVVPTRRLDITMAEDLIEEIGRLYGFEKIPSQMPKAVLLPVSKNEDLIYQDRIKEMFSYLGFAEVYNYSFISEKEAANFKFSLTDLIEVANPVSQEQKYLRPSLIVNLLKNIKENARYFPEAKLFEIGKIFSLSQQKPQEEKRLAGAVILEKKSKSVQGFYYLKGIIDSILNKLGISDQWYDDEISADNSPVPNFAHPNRRAEIKIGDDLIGWLGGIDPVLLEKIDLKTEAAVFEIDFNKLVKMATEERIYASPSKYPAMVRDIALLVEPGTKVEQVLNLIEITGGALVRDVDLFDMYEGEEIPEGKKSLAFHIIYQSDERTLIDQEVNQLQEKIIKALEQENWEVRK